MQVLPSPDGTWACSVSAEATLLVEKYFRGEEDSLRKYSPSIFKPVRIFYDAEDLANRPEPVVLGTLWHEVGHALFTDFRLFYEGQKIAQQEGYLPSSWGLLANGLEDPWVNNRVAQVTEVAHDQIRALYDYDQAHLVEKLPTLPLGAQFALNCSYYWHTGHSAPGLDPAVHDIFERLRPHIDAYFSGESPEHNFEILKNEIWPIYKQLEEKAVEQAKKQALSKRIIRVMVAPPGMCGGAGSGRPSSSNDGDLTIMVGGEGANSQQTDNELQKLLDQLSPEERKALQAALQKAMQEAARQNSADPSDHAQLGENDIDLGSMAPNLRATLDRLSQNLSSASHKHLERSARDILDNAQAKALDATLPAGVQMERNPSSGARQMRPSQAPSEKEATSIEARMQALAEQLERRIKEAADRTETPNASELSDQQIQQSIQAALRESELAAMGFEPHERAAYDRFKILEAAMKVQTTEMVRKLLPILPKKYNHGPDHWFRSGKRFDIKRLMRQEPSGKYDFYERKKLIPGVDPKLFVQLIIDRSGSMYPDKMPEALKTAIFWGKVCSDLGVPFAIKFFDNTFCRVKDYTQPYEGMRNRVKPDLILLAERSGGATNMGAPLSVAFEEMKLARKKFPRSMGAVFVISDAGANAGLTGEPLRALVRRMQEEFVVGAFILSSHPGDITLNHYYFGEENVVAPDNFADLPQESFHILKRTITTFAKRFT